MSKDQLLLLYDKSLKNIRTMTFGKAKEKLKTMNSENILKQFDQINQISHEALSKKFQNRKYEAMAACLLATAREIERFLSSSPVNCILMLQCTLVPLRSSRNLAEHVPGTQNLNFACFLRSSAPLYWRSFKFGASPYFPNWGAPSNSVIFPARAAPKKIR